MSASPGGPSIEVSYDETIELCQEKGKLPVNWPEMLRDVQVLLERRLVDLFQHGQEKQQQQQQQQQEEEKEGEREGGEDGGEEKAGTAGVEAAKAAITTIRESMHSAGRIHYFHCKAVMELMETAEGSLATNLFGSYTSQVLTDWAGLLKAYEKDNILLAEAAWIVARNTQHLAPSLRKTLAAAEKQDQDSTKKALECRQGIRSRLERFGEECRALGLEPPPGVIVHLPGGNNTADDNSEGHRHAGDDGSGSGSGSAAFLATLLGPMWTPNSGIQIGETRETESQGSSTTSGGEEEHTMLSRLEAYIRDKMMELATGLPERFRKVESAIRREESIGEALAYFESFRAFLQEMHRKSLERSRGGQEEGGGCTDEDRGQYSAVGAAAGADEDAFPILRGLVRGLEAGSDVVTAKSRVADSEWEMVAREGEEEQEEDGEEKEASPTISRAPPAPGGETQTPHALESTKVAKEDKRRGAEEEAVALEAFLSARVDELKDHAGNVVTFANVFQACNNPLVKEQRQDKVDQWLGAIRAVLAELRDEKLLQLYLIRDSPAFVDRLVADLLSKPLHCCKLEAGRLEAERRRKEGRLRAYEAKEQLERVVKETQVVKAHLEQALSVTLRTDVRVVGEVKAP